MEGLPSYDQAVEGPDWLDLAAPYVPTRDLRSCCLVNSWFYSHFAPRLWEDPLVTVRAFGLDPNDDLSWYRTFMTSHIRFVRLSTRTLVRSLDFRNFALTASGLYSTEASERAISESFKHVAELFPQLSCILLGNHPELDPEHLAGSAQSWKQIEADSAGLKLLDLSHCPVELSSKYFSSPYFKNLIYLDISYIPGLLRTIHPSLNPETLPELRLLKVQSRELDDAEAEALLRTFANHLWSIDLSNNRLTDRTITSLLMHGFRTSSYRADSHFQTEGRLVRPRDAGTQLYGLFEFVEEAGLSVSFQHPERYLADAPLYSQRADQSELQEWQVVRPNGLEPRQLDDADSVKLHLLSLDATHLQHSRRVHHNVRSNTAGLTHLYLNDTFVTTGAVERLLRSSPGRVEHFECNTSLFNAARMPMPKHLPKTFRLMGMIGSSYVMRPVISSGLRTLRVHHSLVTQIPTVVTTEWTTIECLVFAETVIRQRIETAFPQPYVPDMNPRLTSLTLCGIPARSSGPVVRAIHRFLSQLSAQQRDIKESISVDSGRGPSTLKGLCHLRFELEADFSDDPAATLEEIDYEGMLDPASEQFGVLSDGSAESRPASKGRRLTPTPATSEISSLPRHRRLEGYPYSETESDYITERIEAQDSWNGNVFSVKVWIGSGTSSPHRAVNQYMRHLQQETLRKNIGPATPNHVAAGVPAGSHIFHAAWDYMVFPDACSLTTIEPDIKQMIDVASAIKEFRKQTRGTQDHWLGKLELVRTDNTEHYLSSEYWR